MDGVLADTDPTHKLAFKKYLAEYNIDCTDEYFDTFISGNHNTAIAKMVLGNQSTAQQIKKWSQAKEEYFRNLYAPIAKELNGVTPFLKWLKKHNKKLAKGKLSENDIKKFEKDKAKQEKKPMIFDLCK